LDERAGASSTNLSIYKGVTVKRELVVICFLARCVEGLGLLTCGLGVVPATALTGVAAAHLYLATVGEEDETLVRV
jgi:hypothetical protein